VQPAFSERVITQAHMAYQQTGIVGLVQSCFGERLVQASDREVERQVLALKSGYPHLPATKAAIIMQGFGHALRVDEILSIYASYGLTRGLRRLAQVVDFHDLNRRLESLQSLLQPPVDRAKCQQIHHRYQTIRAYLSAPRQGRSRIIKASHLSRSLFFHYWKNFQQYGLLGLIDKRNVGFRSSKVGLAQEAQLVIDKLQHPERDEAFYVRHLSTKGLSLERSTIAKIFTKWKITHYTPRFVSNLQRLEQPSEFQEELRGRTVIEAPRMVDRQFVQLLAGLRHSGLYVDAPGLLVLWAYLEELGIYPQLATMGLTTSVHDKGYAWFDHFLLNVGRIFYGISSYSRTCTHEDPSLALFAQLVALPCPTSFLKGLGSITETQVFSLQRWLVQQGQALGLVHGQHLAFDFTQIDLDVDLGVLRQFGKGPSPRKKICYNGFRPHIAWDLETGTLVVAEFRKSSARGPTTVKRFVNDFLMSLLKPMFQHVYVDSEYTGKHVWNFILDSDEGMGAELTACLKQNAFVRKHRDQFLLAHSREEQFWEYYDEHHVVSALTFPLTWEYQPKGTQTTRPRTLYCAVKKQINNGKLRCFGTSRPNRTARQILDDYALRWTIENGLKDLIHSYYLNQCPGTEPHQVNVHFFIVSVCRYLYRMIQRDLGMFLRNPDGSVKTLKTMRDVLFRQGCAQIRLRHNTLEVSFLNSYSSSVTQQLHQWYQHMAEKTSRGIELLGGLQLQFRLKPARSDELRNGMTKIPVNSVKNFPALEKID
jgi:hypothetical protein